MQDHFIKSTTFFQDLLCFYQGHLVLQIHFIYVRVSLCRSELRSRSCEKALTSVNRNQNQNRKLNDPAKHPSFPEFGSKGFYPSFPVSIFTFIVFGQILYDT